MKRACVWLFVLLVGLGGCGRKKVVTHPDLPPLAPSPPPHVIAPPPPEQEPPPPASEPAEPDRRPARRPPPKVEPPREPARPEPVKPPPVTPPEEPPQTPQTLQTTPPGGQAEARAQATRLLEQARRDLKQVTYKALNADRKSQYDSANRFIDQAQQALDEQNFVFALRLADKAATLAAGLAGR